MAIKVGTFSNLNVSSGDSGKIESVVAKTTNSSRVKSASTRTSSASSRRSSSHSFDSLTPSIVDDTLLSISSAIQKETAVFEYDSTVYDTELTGSGVVSAYPIILGTLPVTNFYENGKNSNTGNLFDLQNELKDQMIEMSNSIVSKYYETYPSSATELAQIRDSNNEKISSLASNVPKIVGTLQTIVDSTRISVRSDSEQLYVDSSSSTTGADSSKALGLDEIPETSPESGDFGNKLVDYSDDDITKYDGSSIESIVSKLEKKFLGTDKFTRNDQAKTARQYQLLQAALYQVIEGKRLNDVEDTGLKSPYENLEYYAVSGLKDYTYDKIEMNSSLTFAKSTINYAAKAVLNDYFPPKPYLGSADFGFDTDAYGVSINGKFWYDTDAGSYSLGIAPDSSYYASNSSTDIPGWSESPTVSIKQGRVTSEFISQIFISLASDIMKESGYFVESSIPSALNPVSGQGLVPVQDTISDMPRFIADPGNGRKIALFDSSLQGSVEDTASSMSDIILLGNNEIETLQGEISNITSGLTSFVKENKSIISNQCALTIMSVFYKKISNFLMSSILGTDGNTSEASAIRVNCYLLAAHSDTAAGRLFRSINMSSERDTNNYLYRLFAYNGESYNLVTDEIRDSMQSKQVGPASPFSKVQKKFDIDITLGSEQEVLDEIFSSGGSFADIGDVVAEIESIYPGIASTSSFISQNTLLRNKIKIAYYTVFLYYLRKFLGAKIQLAYDSTEFRFRGFVKYYRSDVAFLADCLNEAFTTTQVSDLAFSNFTSVTGAAPSGDEASAGESIYNAVRSSIKGVLQAYQDIRSLIAYQKTVIGSESDGIDSLFSYYENLATLYGGDSQKAASIAARYATIESSAELLYRVNRYLTLVPGTSITSLATRSSNYRSIVKTTFKKLIPKISNLKICIVGIPYGHIERMRLAQESRTFYFGVKVNADDVRTSVDDENDVSYPFEYLSNSETYRPSLAGPYNVYIPGLFDDFNSTINVETTSEGTISFQICDTALTNLSTITRESASDTYKAIDFPALMVQAALQSYVEDLYGLYPRYASTKSSLRDTQYPEESFADKALQTSGYQYSQEDPDAALLYARLRATILMHQDFMSTRMLEEIEASPIFDKIVYVLFEGEKIENILAEVYAKVEV